MNYSAFASEFGGDDGMDDFQSFQQPSSSAAALPSSGDAMASHNQMPAAAPAPVPDNNAPMPGGIYSQTSIGSVQTAGTPTSTMPPGGMSSWTYHCTAVYTFRCKCALGGIRNSILVCPIIIMSLINYFLFCFLFCFCFLCSHV